MTTTYGEATVLEDTTLSRHGDLTDIVVIAVPCLESSPYCLQ